MLSLLSVENFALIDRLQVEFGAGLNLITGETGSGKSILVDAVALLVGERASQDFIREGCDRAVVEGVFHLAAENPVRERLRDTGLEGDPDQLLVRRELSRSGTNRVFINGSPATQSFLAEIGLLLADIHGQHDQQVLIHARSHIEFLDAFGSNSEALEELSLLHRHLVEIDDALRRLSSEEEERLREIDSLRIQIREIESLGLSPGLIQDLQTERKLLAGAEERSRAASQAFELLYESDACILAALDRIRRLLEELSVLDPRFTAEAEALAEMRYPLEDLAAQLRDYTGSIESNPARQEALESRLAEIQRVQRRYGRPGDGLLDLLAAARVRLEDLCRRKAQLEDLQERREQFLAQFLGKARLLSEKRRKDASRLAARVERELSRLAMPEAVFVVELKTSEEAISARGIDSAEFLISANPGEAPRPLARIASGGELSRVVLALKSIQNTERYARTLVFDEVDSGIGGAVAADVGRRLAALTAYHQVFCVTHLAQIASFADSHFHVSKQQRQRRTVIVLRPLNPPQRVEEIARMLAGSQVSETTRQQARELLRQGPTQNALG